MSNENEIKKSNINTKSSLFGKISSKYMQKFIFSFISRYKCPEFAHGLLKYNKGLSHLQSEIKNDNRINQLSNFRNWYYYLKDIYFTLNEVAKKIYNDEYKKLQKLDQNKLDEYKKYAIETIIYVCLFEIVYLTEKKEIFNAKDLKIQKTKSAGREDLDKVSCKSTIFNIIQEAINQSLNSTTSDLKNSINKFFKAVLKLDERGISCQYNYYNIVADYLAKKFPNYKQNNEFKKQDDEFKNDLCCLITKILWLKNNNFYEESISNYDPKWVHIKEADYGYFNFDILTELFLPNPCAITPELMNDTFINYIFDYQTFIKSLQRNDNLFAIVCNNRDFDIRAYLSYNLYDSIKEALPTQGQKDEFQKFLKSKDETDKEIKIEQIPNCEKEDFKDIWS